MWLWEESTGLKEHDPGLACLPTSRPSLRHEHANGHFACNHVLKNADRLCEFDYRLRSRSRSKSQSQSQSLHLTASLPGFTKPSTGPHPSPSWLQLPFAYSCSFSCSHAIQHWADITLPPQPMYPSHFNVGSLSSMLLESHLQPYRAHPHSVPLFGAHWRKWYVKRKAVTGPSIALPAPTWTTSSFVF